MSITHPRVWLTTDQSETVWPPGVMWTVGVDWLGMPAPLPNIRGPSVDDNMVREPEYPNGIFKIYV